MNPANQLQFSKELLEEEMLKIKEQFSWALRNMRTCEVDTPQHQKWFNLVVHLGVQVHEMKEIAKNAPSEKGD